MQQYADIPISKSLPDSFTDLAPEMCDDSVSQ